MPIQSSNLVVTYLSGFNTRNPLMSRSPQPGKQATYNHAKVVYSPFEAAPGGELLLTADPWSFLAAWINQKLAAGPRGPNRTRLEPVAILREPRRVFLRRKPSQLASCTRYARVLRHSESREMLFIDSRCRPRNQDGTPWVVPAIRVETAGANRCTRWQCVKYL